jgi:hypothetical protein
MPVTVGLQNVGSFQVSGWPYINTATLDSNEQEFTFNFVSQEITVWNSGGEDLKFYFTSGSDSVFILPSGKKVTLRVKAGSIFALSDLGTEIKLFVSMTNIPLERIGVIPTGSYVGPIPDSDGDGEPDYADLLPLFGTFGVPYPGINPNPVGSTDLWLEYDDGEGGVLIYDEETEETLLPHVLYLNDCPTSIQNSDLDPVMNNLSAFYINEQGETEELEISYPDLNLIDLLDQNTDQKIPVSVSRTVIGGDTITITVYMTVHLVCIVPGLPTTGYDLEGDTNPEVHDYPTNPDDVTIDPNDNNYEFNEIT